MFELPESGFNRSITKHNVDRILLADWIESSTLFVDSEVSQSDVSDILMEYNIYEDEDFASELLEDTWSDLARRALWLNDAYPFQITGRTIRSKSTSWQDSPALAFCLFLALSRCYRAAMSNWRNQNDRSYVEQGHLFERLTDEALQALGWQVYRTGWASGIQNAAFKKIVSDVAEQLKEPFVNAPILEMYPDANEYGLDIVCHQPFRDGRGGKPVYLLQCASGDDWKDKLQTPDIETWKKFITFSSSPQRAFAMPFTLEDTEFYRSCSEINGMLLDRYRLLSAGASGNNWISSSLKTEIVQWISTRLDALPIFSV